MDTGTETALYILLGIYLAMIIVYPLITILHELGHAFAYMLLTKPERIDIFIGSYGERDTKLKFTTGKLHFFVKAKFPYIHTGGMCQSYTAESNHIYKTIILLAGPFFTVVVALILGFFALFVDVHGSVKLFCFVLMVLSVVSLISNLNPNTLTSPNRTEIESDGKQLSFIMQVGKHYADYINGLNYFGSEEYDLCAESMLKVYNKAPKNSRVLRYLATCHIMLKDYAAAEAYLYKLKENSALATKDHMIRGYLFQMTGRPDLAEGDYRKVLRREISNAAAMNNLGYLLSQAGRYDEAQQLLESAIAIEPEFAFALNNLGYVKIMTGWFDQALELIDKSIQIDSENAHAYKNLGIYYLTVKKKAPALFNLSKAIEMDAEVSADEYLRQALLL